MLWSLIFGLACHKQSVSDPSELPSGQEPSVQASANAVAPALLPGVVRHVPDYSCWDKVKATSSYGWCIYGREGLWCDYPFGASEVPKEAPYGWVTTEPVSEAGVSGWGTCWLGADDNKTLQCDWREAPYYFPGTDGGTSIIASEPIQAIELGWGQVCTQQGGIWSCLGWPLALLEGTTELAASGNLLCTSNPTTTECHAFGTPDTPFRLEEPLTDIRVSNGTVCGIAPNGAITCSTNIRPHCTGPVGARQCTEPQRWDVSLPESTSKTLLAPMNDGACLLVDDVPVCVHYEGSQRRQALPQEGFCNWGHCCFIDTEEGTVNCNFSQADDWTAYPIPECSQG